MAALCANHSVWSSGLVYRFLAEAPFAGDLTALFADAFPAGFAVLFLTGFTLAFPATALAPLLAATLPDDFTAVLGFAFRTAILAGAAFLATGFLATGFLTTVFLTTTFAA